MKIQRCYLRYMILILFIFCQIPSKQLQAKDVNFSEFNIVTDTISEATFMLWTNTWNTQGRAYMANNLLRAFNLPIMGIRNLMTLSPASVRFYFGLNVQGGNSVAHLILVGFDAAGNKISSYFNASTPCPSTCENMDFSPDFKDSGADKNPNTISINTFKAWNNGWATSGQSYMQQNLIQYFNMPVINLVNLNNQNTAGVRFYLGLDTTTSPNAAHLNMVGVDQNGKDVLDQIYNESAPCPSDCGIR